jgi:hypothetical protein
MTARVHASPKARSSAATTGSLSVLGLVLLLALDLSAHSAESNTSGSPGDGVSSSPDRPKGARGRLDYKHARPFPLPSIDCEPRQDTSGNGSVLGRPCEGTPRPRKESPDQSR